MEHRVKPGSTANLPRIVGPQSAHQVHQPHCFKVLCAPLCAPLCHRYVNQNVSAQYWKGQPNALGHDVDLEVNVNDIAELVKSALAIQRSQLTVYPFDKASRDLPEVITEDMVLAY